MSKTETGQWWGAWLIERDASGRLVEHKIGEIRAQPNNTEIRTSSILNFSEYWGEAVPRCDLVSMSVVGWAPPKINYTGAGTAYAAVAAAPSPRTPPGNVCNVGAEKAGAFHSYLPAQIGGGNGAIVALGGAMQPNRKAVEDASKSTTRSSGTLRAF